MTSRKSNNSVVAKGRLITISIDGEPYGAHPVLSKDGSGNFGIGLYIPERKTATVWGLMIGGSLIQWWRAMKILENLKKIEDSTLAATFYAAQECHFEDDERYVAHLGEIYGNLEQFQQLRACILKSRPTENQMRDMVSQLKKQDIEIPIGYLPHKDDVEHVAVIFKRITDSHRKWLDKEASKRKVQEQKVDAAVREDFKDPTPPPAPKWSWRNLFPRFFGSVAA